MRIAIEVIGRGISKRNYSQQIARHPEFHKSKHVFYYIKRTYMTKKSKIKLIQLLWSRVFLFWVETMVES